MSTRQAPRRFARDRNRWRGEIIAIVAMIPLAGAVGVLAAAESMYFKLAAVAGAAILLLVAVSLAKARARHNSEALNPPAPKPPVDSDRRRLELMAAAAVIVFVLGTFVWRSRSASDLSDTPVDSAGGVRLAADGIAALLVLMSAVDELRLARSRHSWKPRGLLTAVTGLYLAYIAIAAVGILEAVAPSIVAFRVFELIVSASVGAAAARWIPFTRLLHLLQTILFGMSALIIGSALAFPSIGFGFARGGLIPFRLEGVYPTFSYNSVGYIGILLAAVSLGVVRFRWTGVAVGAALVFFSQYRTGYVAFAVVLGAYLLASTGLGKKLALAALLPIVLLVTQSAAFQTAWIRGEAGSDSTGNLSGRTDWWAAGFQVAQRSPVIGTGLSSGTRFEVLAGIIGDTDASTIHGTWIEAFVGTGYLGVAVLGAFVLATIIVSWTHRRISVAPFLLMVAVIVRSLSGSSVELANYTLVFVVAAVVGLSYASTQPSALTRWRAERRERQTSRELQAYQGAARVAGHVR